MHESAIYETPHKIKLLPNSAFQSNAAALTRSNLQLPKKFLCTQVRMELSQETPSSSQPQTQPDPAAQAAAAAHYFASRAAAAAAAGLLRTDREHLCDLEHKLLQARQRFQDLKEQKCNAGSKGCGCGCCSHGYVRPRDQKETSIGPDSRSVSETSHLPPKKAAGGRQHLTRSSTQQLGGASTTAQRRSLRINSMLRRRPSNCKDIDGGIPCSPPVFDV